jgi:hypothetical protein
MTATAATPVALPRRRWSVAPRSITRCSNAAIRQSTTRIASIAAPCFDALPFSESTAGKRLAATAAAAAQPRVAIAIATARQSRTRTSSTITPTTSAPNAPRENVR